MSSSLKTPFTIAAALVAIFAGANSASAQDISDSRPAAPRVIPGVRYTTGTVTTSGWERTLTDANPNLKRWNWSPITSYTQSTFRNVPARTASTKEPVALKPAGHIYTKPVQVSADAFAKRRPQPGVIVLGNNRNSAEVNGRVNLPRTIAQMPEAKSYNVNYGVGGHVGGSHSRDNTIAARSVSGHLVR